jgi:hypothetical protein
MFAWIKVEGFPVDGILGNLPFNLGDGLAVMNGRKTDFEIGVRQ